VHLFSGVAAEYFFGRNIKDYYRFGNMDLTGFRELCNRHNILLSIMLIDLVIFCFNDYLCINWKSYDFYTI